MSASETSLVRFGVIELDLKTGELRKAGALLRLPPQPFKILALLASQPGQLVTREEIQHQIWGSETFVDFELGLNAAIKTIRDVLGDDAEEPRYIETLPRRGYRFIAPVETAPGAASEQETPTSAHETPHRGVSTSAAAAPPESVASMAVRADGVRQPATAKGTRRMPQRRAVAMAGAGLVAVVAVLLALNVAGLRERVLTVVGAGSARPREGALPYPKIESIAVLPLENLSGDREQEYFADGMTDALITDLGQISALRVISRTSINQYKAAKKSMPEIARELNVDAIVEGTVQRSGDRVRITAQLIHAPTDRHLWARSYERDVRDVLTLQAEVAGAIASEVHIKLRPQEQARLASVRPVNPEAHELYLKGSYSSDRQDFNKAIEYFEQAIQKDPKFARAYVGIGTAYGRLGEREMLSSVEAFAKEKAFARKALELDSGLAEAHVALGFALWQGDWDWAGAEREFQQALEINPNSAAAHFTYSHYLSTLARHEKAITGAMRVLEIAPLVVGAYEHLGWTYYRARRYDEARAQFERALQIDPNFPLEAAGTGVYREKGMYREAIAGFLQMPDVPPKFGHMGNAYGRAGNKAEAYKAIQNLTQWTNQNAAMYEVAIVYTGLSDKDRAFQWLEKAYQGHDKALCYLKVDPPLDPLRSDPRFHDLLRRMNFPP